MKMQNNKKNNAFRVHMYTERIHLNVFILCLAEFQSYHFICIPSHNAIQMFSSPRIVFHCDSVHGINKLTISNTIEWK